MKMFNVFRILLAITLLAGGQAFAWTVAANFESGTVGNKAEGTSGFTEAGSQTILSSEKSASGSKSAKMTWPQGSDGWGIAHGYLDYPNVANESEIWARAYFYFASPWSWSCNPVSKVIRLHIAHSNGSNAGYHSILLNSAGNIVVSNEIADIQPDTGVKFDIDKWQSIEMYVKLSTSDPIFRIWKNGILIYEDRAHNTMSSTSDFSDSSYIMTYWNGGAPQNQTQYVDEVLFTNERPSEVDSKGNSMIGSGSVTSPIVAPAPPYGLKVQ